jgi:hypothetical protein
LALFLDPAPTTAANVVVNSPPAAGGVTPIAAPESLGTDEIGALNFSVIDSQSAPTAGQVELAATAAVPSVVAAVGTAATVRPAVVAQDASQKRPVWFMWFWRA